MAVVRALSAWPRLLGLVSLRRCGLRDPINKVSNRANYSLIGLNLQIELV